MEEGRHLYEPAALYPGKGPPITIGKEAGWSPQPAWTRWRREKIPAPDEEPNPGRPFRSLVTIQTELSRLFQVHIMKFI
jgi:hypothetical protein